MRSENDVSFLSGVFTSYIYDFRTILENLYRISTERQAFRSNFGLNDL